MPICICPQCSKSHKIPAKNLGLKGRCTQCRTIFELVEQPDSPPAVEPVPPPPTVPTPPDPNPVFESETFSFRPPEPPKAPEAVQPVSEDSTSDNEFDWLDEIEEEPDPTNQRRVGKNGGRSSVIEPLPRRIALEIIARWLWFIAAVELFCATICIVLGILAIAGRSHLWLMLIASGVSGIFSGLIFLAMSELLSMARGIESRLHEISKNISI